MVKLLQRNRKPDPRIRRTSRLIREALVRLIDEKGYDAITVLDITDRADINRSTFYYHYRDKDELLQQSIQDMLALAEKEVHLPPGLKEQEADEDHLLLLTRLMDHIGEHEDFYRIMLRHIPQLGRRLSALICQLTASPHDSNASPRPTPINVNGQEQLLEAIIRWLEEQPPRSSAAIARLLQQLT